MCFFFIGWVCSLLWLPSLSDRHGRWLFYSSTIAVDTILYLVISVTKSIDVAIVVFFIYGYLTSIRLNVGFVYLMEMMPRQYRTVAGTFWCLCGINMLLAISFYTHSEFKEYVSLGAIAFVCQAVMLVGSLVLPESPAILVENDRLEEAKESLESIAQWNS